MHQAAAIGVSPVVATNPASESNVRCALLQRMTGRAAASSCTRWLAEEFSGCAGRCSALEFTVELFMEPRNASFPASACNCFCA